MTDYVFIFFNLVLLGGISFLAYKKLRIDNLQVFYLPLLLLKVAAGLGLGYIYITYYEWGDTISYFQEGQRFADISRADFTAYIKEIFNNSGDYVSMYDRQPRALLISKITSFFALITNNNYWLSSIYFSVFGFNCLWLLARSLVRVTSNFTSILISLFLFPSVVFWSSGISKESLALGAIALLTKVFIDQLYSKVGFKLSQVAIFLFSLILLWSLKYYYAASFVLFAFTGGLVYMLSFIWEKLKSSHVLQLVVFVLIVITSTAIISTTKLNFNVDRLPKVIVENNKAFMDKSAPEDVIHYTDLEPTYQNIIINTPLALISGLFRPLPGDGSGLLAWVIKIENILVVIFSIYALVYFFRNQLDLKDRLVVYTALGYTCFLAIFLALSAPNFGTLSRYKIGFMPIFILIITIPNPWILKLNRWFFRQ